jgi:hypothetical protein
MIPGEVACIMSGLNLVTSENILGLNANERGTFWYKGHGKLKKKEEFQLLMKWGKEDFFQI